MVAGVIANFLAYDTIPFVITGKNLPTEAKKYLKEKASWSRQKDVPAIWNRVTEANNPKKAGVASVESTSQPTTTAAPTTSAPPATPTPVAPYAQGTCHIHVDQWNIDSNGLYDLDVLMTDNDGHQIGYTQPLGNPSGKNYVPPNNNDGYSNSNPLSFQSKLEDLLICTPEHQNDYIQFSLRGQAWPSNGDFGNGDIPSCSVGAWDGADDPSAYLVCNHEER